MTEKYDNVYKIIDKTRGIRTNLLYKSSLKTCSGYTPQKRRTIIKLISGGVPLSKNSASIISTHATTPANPNTIATNFIKFFISTIIQKNSEDSEEKKVGVARLKPARYDNSKGPRIGPSLFYTSKLHSKYIK